MERLHVISLQLSESEGSILATALDSYLSDLRMEIANTDRKDFRDGLKLRKEALTNVLEQLRR